MSNRINGILGVLLALVGMTTSVLAASAPPSYTATASVTYSFVDISASGTGILAGTDDGKAAIAIGFPFSFYGQTYSTVCVSTNGLLSFGSCDPALDFNNQDLTSAGTPGNLPAIAPFWTDLSFAVTGSGAFQYQTIGTAGSRQFIAQWTTAYVVRAMAPVTFQVILSEGSNNILVQYKNVEVGAGSKANEGGRSTVGIRDADGQTNGRRVQWSYNAPVLANNTALLFSAGSTASTVNITLATAPAGLQVVADSVAYTAPKTFSWTQGSAHTLSVASPQAATGVRNTFASWSNGGTQSQSITTPGTATTYTATFSTQYQLTTSVYPSGSGTITAGGYFNAGSSVQITATAKSGYVFRSFSGDLTASTSPQSLTMSGPKNVVANFTQVVPALTAMVTGRSGTQAARVWTITVTNNGLGAAQTASITGVTLTQSFGTTCSPAASISTRMPVTVGNLAASGGTGTGNVTINFAGCPANARFTAKIAFQANSGAYTGSTTSYNLTE